MSGNKRSRHKRLKEHYSRGMTDDQLIAAWMLEFGDRPVSSLDIRRADDDTQEVYHTMATRGLLEWHDVNHNIDAQFINYIYTLKKTLENADR